ncbi:DsbA family protein [Saliphagus infecundisoli]|uniref:DsbA family protein n=1 Tax=Saliphagus infecundisoli TaxID=1849069 RepID=A0ABD5Q957_9EURY|nr:thioredoxin domain-containing protein [Saliphagus infecundisoli]
MSQTSVNDLNQPVTERDHTYGPADASVTLVEYGDYECPYCEQAHRVMKELRGELNDEVQFVFRNFPLRQMHPHAELAAEAAEAASAQGAFWEMHDHLYEHQDALEREDLDGYAAELGLDEDEFVRALNEGRHEERVQQDFLNGAHSGVNATPTFFINGTRYDGQWDAPTLRAALEDAMRQ